jgi:hypothetical protein
MATMRMKRTIPNASGVKERGNADRARLSWSGNSSCMNRGECSFDGMRAHCTLRDHAIARSNGKTMRSFARMALTAGIALSSASACFATESPPPLRLVSGPVILTRAGSIASFLWDATPYVAGLVEDRILGEQGTHTLEASALSALASSAASVTAPDLSLKVVYSRTGAVSTAYGGATFAGVEPVLTVSVRRADLAKHAVEWERQLLDGVVPSAVKISVTGNLPPS